MVMISIVESFVCSTDLRADTRDPDKVTECCVSSFLQSGTFCLHLTKSNKQRKEEDEQRGRSVPSSICCYGNIITRPEEPQVHLLLPFNR